MASLSKDSLILDKAREVLKEAENLVQYLQKKGFTEPNFTATSPPHPANHEYDVIRISLTEAAEDLVHLAKGPIQWFRTLMYSLSDMGAWQTAVRFKYFSIIPLDKPMSVKEIAAATKMDEDRLGRIMKILASQHCFEEVEEDVYGHTSVSAFIAQNQDIQAIAACVLNETFEAASLTATAIERAPYTSDSPHSAFHLRFGTDSYTWYKENQDRATNFASAMAGVSRMNRARTELRDGFPWGSLRKKRVVDVGGGSGHISIYLATQFPELEFFVQDVNPDMLVEGPKLPEFKSVEKRVSFMQYDFREPQPVTDAGLFMIRQVLHNYPDDVCVQIFKSFVPALEKSASGTSILISEILLPEMNAEPKVQEHHLRQFDILMLSSFAAKERTVKEFARLLKQADERLEITKLHQKGVNGLLEVQLAQ
ncbi:putative O-methyltransferase [Hypomontagnella submonticulosa]|nr:putative O-methyltransferase [Hypomontagnella submonticulosa]